MGFGLRGRLRVVRGGADDGPGLAADEGRELEWVRVSDNAKGFEFADRSSSFRPWGFNYDHDRDGRLIEDYWHEEWKTVEEDFREMKALGANAVRVHLQFGRFMKNATEPEPKNLDRLGKLLRLAAETRLYLDLTGLGCYHKKDVPAWYDAMDESERWAAQARFWEAVARACADSPAVFCYDLMNEPVAPAGKSRTTDEWLGPPFGGKHFVQRISLDQAGRERWQIAKAWIDKLTAAIRRHDRRHLITVGLVDWSLDRPGLQSGFVPSRVASSLDFLCVHLYPQSGRVNESLETLAGFAAAGKPVVIEEIFPLGCSIGELGRFITDSKSGASGWLGFYWGKTIDEHPAPPPVSLNLPPDKLKEELAKNPEAFGNAITRAWLEFFRDHRP